MRKVTISRGGPTGAGTDRSEPRRDGKSHRLRVSANRLFGITRQDVTRRAAANCIGKSPREVKVRKRPDELVAPMSKLNYLAGRIGMASRDANEHVAWAWTGSDGRIVQSWMDTSHRIGWVLLVASDGRGSARRSDPIMQGMSPRRVGWSRWHGRTGVALAVALPRPGWER